MPVFGKPKTFDFNYSVAEEKKNFSKFFKGRDIPKKKKNEIYLATWNIANLGAQKRRDKDLQLIAFILSHFDIIAVQEVRAQLAHLNRIMELLNKKASFKCVFNDVAGNSERLAVIYNTKVIEPRQLTAELDYNPNGKIVKGKYVIPVKKMSVTAGKRKINLFFSNFNRNPFLTTWQVKKSNYNFLLASTHIYWGDYEKRNVAKFKQRIAEVYYLADWARTMRLKKNKDRIYEKNVILLGDMNIPTVDKKDPVFAALKRKGMLPSKYASQTGTTLKEFYRYDQVVFTDKNSKLIKINKHPATVVDFDSFIFRKLWKRFSNLSEKKRITQFKAWTKFTISDHRPLFVRIRV